ncbi:hypothetical protein MCGE09_00092 [Thaumarchaeota archaeon SCGC AB-539-E09]|nr:hypothetical protein MCGE09_00092 [Thaumarchaeota archaeon SCGC AB-539-E09]
MRCLYFGGYNKKDSPLYDPVKPVFSEFNFSGKILAEENDISNNKRFLQNVDKLKVMLLIFSFMLIISSGFLYYQLDENQILMKDFQERYAELYNDYYILLNTTSSTNAQYEELKDIYTTLRGEYNILEERYVVSLQEKGILEREHNDIINFKKNITLEDDRELTLSAGSNMTLIYSLNYAGYIEVNFSSSTDIVFWVGSSITDNEYYSRIPPFPDTIMIGSFRIPVTGTVYLSVFNASNEVPVTLTISIRYIY